MQARTKFNSILNTVPSLIPCADDSLQNSANVMSSIQYFDSALFSTPICVQDSVHIGTKLRNRLLNSSLILQIGNRKATTVHLKNLIRNVPKEIHGLSKSDIFPEDRQNFKSLEKISEDRVLLALKNHKVDSEATVKYIEICRDITAAYISDKLMPIDGIYKIWLAVYFLRCWRKFIHTSSTCNLSENFISKNAYTCIEINAQALVALTILLRSRESMFLPSLFASQPCEYIFRQMRSLGTTNFTKINFSMYELLHMIARVELTNKIAYSEEKQIHVPRIQARIQANLKTGTIKKLPCDQEIIKTMNRARQDALKEAALFGIFLTENDIINTVLTNGSATSLLSSLLDIFDDEDEEYENIIQSSELNSSTEAGAGLYVEVINPDGSIKKVRKSTLIWTLTESSSKLSSDRLKRVKGVEIGPNEKKMKSIDFEKNLSSKPIFSKSVNVQFSNLVPI